MTFLPKRILIIGGCGYIGSELGLYLKGKSRISIVESIDLEWFGNYGIIPNIKSDFNKLDKDVLRDFDVIILLAGHSSVGMCQDNLNGAFQNNLANFISLIQKIGRQQFIYASSSSVYGNINRNLMTEAHEEYAAANFYDFSKYEIDTYMKLYGKLEYYGLRFGTVNGPSPNFRDDVMINSMFKSAKVNNHIKISNPHIRRPILGINDLCRAIYSIIMADDAKKSGIYNLASFNSTVEIIGTHAAKELNVPLRIAENTSKAYDFAISTAKFEQAFNFSFQETPQSIINNLKLRDNSMVYTNRNTYISYGI